MISDVLIFSYLSRKPQNETLTLSGRSWVIGPAHCLTERNVWVEFNENRSKGSGDMEWTWIERVNPITLKCDLDLESEDPVYGFCTPLYGEEHLGELYCKSFKGFRRHWAGAKLLGTSHYIEVWPLPWVKLNENCSKRSLKLFCTDIAYWKDHWHLPWVNAYGFQ